MGTRLAPEPLIPLIKPYADASIPNLVELNSRQIIRAVAGWLTTVSYNPRTNFVAAIALRTTARLLQKEAIRIVPPGEASHASSQQVF
jgi:hypothetical protein